MFFGVVNATLYLAAAVTVLSLIYYNKTIPPITAFLDVQISGLLGGFKLLKGADYKWERSRPST